jgi:hypothetical protein
MILRVGNVETDVKVAAVMSTPRLAFTDNLLCVSAALAPHGLSPIKVTGAYWSQCLARAMEQVVDTHDFILTIDYDTVFNAKTVEALLVLALQSGVDAIAPLQVKRESDAVMFSMPDSDPHAKSTVNKDWFEKPVQLVGTAHFGLTFLRTSALRRLPKPWFMPTPNDRGEFNGGHIDEDVGFWKLWQAAGNTLGIATNVSVGHCELMVTWPSMGAPGNKVQQHSTEYWNSGQKAPKEAWGQIT